MTDILRRLEEDARRLRVARKLPEKDIPLEMIYEIIDEFEQVREANQISYSSVAGDLGISASMISTIKHAREEKYKGDLQKVARMLNSWMENYARRQATPMPTDFVLTKAAERMLQAAHYATASNTMCVIYASAGVGKSMAAKAIASKYYGSIYLRVRRSARNATGLAKLLKAELKLEKCRTMFDIQGAIIAKLGGTTRALLIDEAHQLSLDALELLRDIHDEAGIPIILFGTREINDKVSDLLEWSGQMNRRIGIRADVTQLVMEEGPDNGGRPLFSVDEIKQVFERQEVRFTAKGAAFLARLANIPGYGGLGLVDKIVRIAGTTEHGKALTRSGKGVDERFLLAVLNLTMGKTEAKRISNKAAEVKGVG